jgi:hypothetical protein
VRCADLEQILALVGTAKSNRNDINGQPYCKANPNMSSKIVTILGSDRWGPGNRVEYLRNQSWMDINQPFHGIDGQLFPWQITQIF